MVDTPFATRNSRLTRACGTMPEPRDSRVRSVVRDLGLIERATIEPPTRGEAAERLVVERLRAVVDRSTSSCSTASSGSCASAAPCATARPTSSSAIRARDPRHRGEGGRDPARRQRHVVGRAEPARPEPVRPGARQQVRAAQEAPRAARLARRPQADQRTCRRVPRRRPRHDARTARAARARCRQRARRRPVDVRRQRRGPGRAARVRRWRVRSVGTARPGARARDGRHRPAARGR